jgi:hypothetical protein
MLSDLTHAEASPERPLRPTLPSHYLQAGVLSLATIRHYPKFASLLLLLSAQPANADLLFTNFDGDPTGDSLYTGGGPCSFASCFAIADNFSSDGVQTVGGFTFYVLSGLDAGAVGSNVRYALFTSAGAEIVAPSDTPVTVTDTGLTGELDTHIYKLEISGLNINLPLGEYQFRFTNAVEQGVYPAAGTPSAQSLSPGLIQLTGSSSLDPLLSTDSTQRSQELAFQVYGIPNTIFADNFED